ncbi:MULTISPECIES: hypothetical protein [unclassified Holdemania]|uniref:hypothetical protein n=1 Tax=unclassified Holdemania TaxID=2637685 RepID=UPI000933EA79|nr:MULTISPECIES: hypothetical protein [unclassified Holdemania]
MSGPEICVQQNVEKENIIAGCCQESMLQAALLGCDGIFHNDFSLINKRFPGVFEEKAFLAAPQAHSHG